MFLLSRKHVLMCAMAFSLAGCKWSIGSSNYEECVSDEMKDRNMDHLNLVEQSCREKFPVLKTFKNVSHIGVLTCVPDKGNQTPFEINIGENEIQIPLGSFEITDRSERRVLAKSTSLTAEGQWKDGAGLVINFVYGLGSLYDINDQTKQSNVSCREGGKIIK